MQYEQDYIMRLIKQVIRALIGVLMNKKSALYYIFPVNGQQKSGDDFLQRLTHLANEGRICEAENMLFAAMESGTDDVLYTGLLFYEHLNEFEDDYLEAHNFSRDEIQQGVLEIAKRMGSFAMANAVLFDIGGMETSL